MCHKNQFHGISKAVIVAAAKCHLPRTAWSPEAEQIPFSGGAVIDLLPPRPDPASVHLSFPSNLPCPDVFRWYHANDQARLGCPPLSFFCSYPSTLWSLLLAWQLTPTCKGRHWTRLGEQAAAETLRKFLRLYFPFLYFLSWNTLCKK